jgi:hypothetical protein
MYRDFLMLTSSFVPGVSELFHYFGSQLAATSAPTDDPPPALSWRFGQMRRWHPTSSFLYAINAIPPIEWWSVASHAARAKHGDGNLERPRRLRG